MPVLAERQSISHGLCIGVLMLGSLACRPAMSQSSPSTPGLEVRGGLGPGFSKLDWSCRSGPTPDGIGRILCAKDVESRLAVVAGHAAVLARLNHRLSLGGEVYGSFGANQTVYAREARRQMGLHLVGIVYPTGSRQAFIKVGLGLAQVGVDSTQVASAPEGITHAGSSLGITIGGGYDFPLGSRYVVSPYVEFPLATRFRGGSPSTFSLGVEFGVGFD